MRVLQWSGSGVVLGKAPVPTVLPGFTRVRVELAGICRTDLLVAEGMIPVPVGRVLGHELVGWTESGMRVAVFPGTPCGNCLPCKDGGAPWKCCRPGMLGIEGDGAFAEWVRVPESCVFPLPVEMDAQLGAFVEPVAAALGVVEADRRLEARILVYGRGRVAELTERLLVFCGRKRVVRLAPGERVVPASFDLAIETTGKSEDIAVLLGALVPGGTLVLKSRLPGMLSFDPSLVVRKGLKFMGVHYGDFQEAIQVLQRGLPVKDLFATPVPLERWSEALVMAREEGQKQFLQIGTNPGI